MFGSVLKHMSNIFFPQEDSDESGDDDSDAERALREKALKSIKKKYRARRETSEDEMSAD